MRILCIAKGAVEGLANFEMKSLLIDFCGKYLLVGRRCKILIRYLTFQRPSI